MGNNESVGTMRAAVREAGGIVFKANWPRPSNPGVGQVRLRIYAAAINPVDYKLPKWISGDIAGLDLAGVVEMIGEGVTDFKVGDQVFGTTSG